MEIAMIGMMFRRTTIAGLVLTIVGALFAATATPSQALGTANVQSDSTYVLLDSVYAGATYNLNTLVGGEAQDVVLQASSQDDAELKYKNGAPYLHIYLDSEGQSIFFYATVDSVSYYYEQPVKEILPVPVKRKLGHGKVKFTNPYDDPVTIKYQRETAYRKILGNFDLQPGTSIIVRSKYRTMYWRLWVHFQGKTIGLQSGYVNGIKMR